MTSATRRDFLTTAAGSLAVLGASGLLPSTVAAQEKKGGNIRFGLVTYQWGKDWDLPTLIANLVKTKVLGVELRTTHKHGVEPALNDLQRAEVRGRFVDSGVTCLGIGSDERFDNPDPAVVKKAIEASKAFVQLCHDIGGSGVKVKPDRFWPNVPKEKTIEQIGKALNELGEFAEGFGQQIRLEVHGQCQELPTIKAIMDVADNPNVAVCWNSNPTDLQGAGLEANFAMVSKRFGATSHVHVLDMKDYPFAKLFDLYVAMDYEGWWLLEEGKVPTDPVTALGEQKVLFDKMLAESRTRAG
ncbi:MAG: TIM barrel protein [Planctomycetaceae bacterium]|nr:TIM barrel protein [Planctomycetaceae bacterium]